MQTSDSNPLLTFLACLALAIILLLPLLVPGFFKRLSRWMYVRQAKQLDAGFDRQSTSKRRRKSP